LNPTAAPVKNGRKRPRPLALPFGVAKACFGPNTEIRSLPPSHAIFGKNRPDG
jgi:hypothetical protein